MKRNFQHFLFLVRIRYGNQFLSFFRRLWYNISGMHVGKGTRLPAFKVTWPHQVHIGDNCKLEHGIYFKFDGIWMHGPAIKILDSVFLGSGCEFNIRKGIVIEQHSLIASGCRFIDHDHGIVLGTLIGTQHGPEKEIIIRSDVWLGCNVIVLKGVEIGMGSVVAAGAVVTKSIPANEIWGGIPARKIGERKEK